MNRWSLQQKHLSKLANDLGLAGAGNRLLAYFMGKIDTVYTTTLRDFQRIGVLPPFYISEERRVGIDALITFEYILEEYGIRDALWLLHTVPYQYVITAFMVDCAAPCLQIHAKVFPHNGQYRRHQQDIISWFVNKITDDEIIQKTREIIAASTHTKIPRIKWAQRAIAYGAAFPFSATVNSAVFAIDAGFKDHVEQRFKHYFC